MRKPIYQFLFIAITFVATIGGHLLARGGDHPAFNAEEYEISIGAEPVGIEVPKEAQESQAGIRYGDRANSPIQIAGCPATDNHCLPQQPSLTEKH